MRVVGAGDGFARPVRVWNVPSPHEDNRLSWPDRQAIRRASDDTELEHNSCDPANFEGSEEHAITGDLAHPCRASMSAIDFSPINEACAMAWYKMHHFRELTRVKMRIVVQKQRGESLAS